METTPLHQNNPHLLLRSRHHQHNNILRHIRKTTKHQHRQHHDHTKSIRFHNFQFSSPRPHPHPHRVYIQRLETIQTRIKCICNRSHPTHGSSISKKYVLRQNRDNNI